jgi:hypothetical protein
LPSPVRGPCARLPLPLASVLSTGTPTRQMRRVDSRRLT